MKWDKISLVGAAALLFLGMFTFVSVLLPSMLNVNDTFINILGAVLFVMYLVIMSKFGRRIIVKWKEIENEELS